MTVKLNPGLTAGELTGEISQMHLQGIAVSSAEEGGPVTVLGPVTVDLGLFKTVGTIGAPGQGGESGGEEGEDSSLAAEFTLYVRIDATALGMGVLVNTRPVVADGPVSAYPLIGTALTFRGGGSPPPLRDEVTGAEGAARAAC
ncbi:MAG: hypothetical protein U0835_01660 [Isosphaeraceae bacterium]